MRVTNSTLFVFIISSIICYTGCSKEESAAGEGKVKKTEYQFALIAKNQSNPVFQAARVGMEDAAKELSEKLDIRIKAIWRTPNEEDAQRQADFIEQLVLEGIDGISISCSIADVVTPAINDAVEQGVDIMCFDSDAPKSKRFCYHGTDDIDCGRIIMRELIEVLGPGDHVVAIPGGNQNAANIQNRIKGALEEAKKHSNIKIKGVYYSKETPQDAAAKVEEVQTANPDISGWAMVGAWALFTDALMKWEPGKIKIVAADALPAELPYVRKGIVAKLYAQHTYNWGYRSIEILANKIILDIDPKSIHEYSALIPVSKENVDEFAKNWEKWLH